MPTRWPVLFVCHLEGVKTPSKVLHILPRCSIPALSSCSTKIELPLSNDLRIRRGKFDTLEDCVRSEEDMQRRTGMGADLGAKTRRGVSEEARVTPQRDKEPCNIINV